MCFPMTDWVLDEVMETFKVKNICKSKYIFFQMLHVSHIILIIFLTQVIQVPVMHTIISHQV